MYVYMESHMCTRVRNVLIPETWNLFLKINKRNELNIIQILKSLVFCLFCTHCHTQTMSLMFLHRNATLTYELRYVHKKWSAIVTCLIETCSWTYSHWYCTYLVKLLSSSKTCVCYALEIPHIKQSQLLTVLFMIIDFWMITYSLKIYKRNISNNRPRLGMLSHSEICNY